MLQSNPERSMVVHVSSHITFSLLLVFFFILPVCLFRLRACVLVSSAQCGGSGECEKPCCMTLLLRSKYGQTFPVLMQTHVARANDGDHIAEIYTMTPLQSS